MIVKNSGLNLKKRLEMTWFWAESLGHFEMTCHTFKIEKKKNVIFFFHHFPLSLRRDQLLSIRKRKMLFLTKCHTEWWKTFKKPYYFIFLYQRQVIHVNTQYQLPKVDFKLKSHWVNNTHYNNYIQKGNRIVWALRPSLNGWHMAK